MAPTRNRLRKLKLSELSLVDRPANPHAVVVVAKRAPEPLLFEDVLAVLKGDASCTSDVHHDQPLGAMAMRRSRKKKKKEAA